MNDPNLRILFVLVYVLALQVNVWLAPTLPIRDMRIAYRRRALADLGRMVKRAVRGSTGG